MLQKIRNIAQDIGTLLSYTFYAFILITSVSGTYWDYLVLTGQMAVMKEATAPKAQEERIGDPKPDDDYWLRAGKEEMKKVGKAR